MTCSGETKVTTIILKVDLQCCQCYKKVKRSLCRFPQIRDQVYDEKQNTVTITVVCCSPERIMDKLCSKAGKSIKSIHIKPPPSSANKPASDHPKPKQPAVPAPAPAPASAAPEPDKPKPKPAPEAKPPAPASDDNPPMKKNGSKNASKNGSKPEQAPAPKPSPDDAPKPAAPAPAPKPIEPAQLTEPVAQWVPGYPPGPPPQVYPVSVYCDGGYAPAGPGYYQYGRPPCPPGYYGNRCDYFSEENPSACSIM